MSSSDKVITIEHHIVDGKRAHPGATGALSAILRELSLAFKIIYREVSKAGLVNILGLVGRENIQGEQVKKLDAFADEKIIQTLSQSGQLCVMASEEHELPIPVTTDQPLGKYVVLFDPLDGSANIDINAPIGSIFAIYRRMTPSGPGSLADCLQPGYKQVAAGYVVYGSSTMLVYTTGDGVHGFTLDPSIGEFVLSHENIRIPKRGRTYSINEGNTLLWQPGMREYIQFLQQEDKATGRPYSGRYIGAMIADIHRTLLSGGIFMYPGDRKNQNGKLRLLYEANPMAFIVEQAGGRSSNGTQRLLDVQPATLHQRTPVLLGSEEDVILCEEFLQGKRGRTATAG
jgi:fructose-1,6-bisphosphatase I